MDALRQAISICPERLRKSVEAWACSHGGKVEELRLRRGKPLTLLWEGKEQALEAYRGEESSFASILSRATGQAIYAAQEMLAACFLTVPGGHRLGICGRGVYREGSLFTVKEISSLNLRVARAHRGIGKAQADYLWTHPSSVLIIGPPGRGKTSLLRDLIRNLSDRFGWRICVADERMELGACFEGSPQFDLGLHTDILSAVKKGEAIELLLRSMNPQWIAVDEISSLADVNAMVQASYCGVRFLATAHAVDREELQQRPVYRELLRTGLFQTLFTILPDRRVQMERL